jgi:hypothetical protein
MAVAHDAFSNSTAGTGNLSWTHTPTGTPRGVLVLVDQTLSATDQVSGVTYGGETMTRVTTTSATGPDCRSYAYFLGENIPTGAQTVDVTVSGSATKQGGCVTQTASDDCEVDAFNQLGAAGQTNPTVSVQTVGNTTEVYACAAIEEGSFSCDVTSPDTQLLKAGDGNSTRSFAQNSVQGSGGSLETIGWTYNNDSIAACIVAIREVGDLPAIIVATTAESSTNTAGTSHVITLPSGIAAGDLILICLDKGSTAATIDAHADYQELLDENSANGLYIAYRYAAGGESNPTLTTSASTRTATITLRIVGAENPATQAPEIAASTATGTSATPDPPQSATPPSTNDYLFVAFFGQAGEEADDDTWVNTPPTNYGPTPPLQKSCGTAGTNLGGKIGLAYRLLNTGAAQDPGTFGVDVSAAYRAQTIMIHPASGAAPAAIPALVMAPPIPT